MFKRLRNMSNGQYTRLTVIVFNVLMALPLAHALTVEDPAGRLMEIVPLIVLGDAALAVGLVMVWLPEWLKGGKGKS